MTLTPKKYLKREGWFCYTNKKGNKSFKISTPFENLNKKVQIAYKNKIEGKIIFNHWSLFL